MCDPSPRKSYSSPSCSFVYLKRRLIRMTISSSCNSSRITFPGSYYSFTRPMTLLTILFLWFPIDRVYPYTTSPYYSTPFGSRPRRSYKKVITPAASRTSSLKTLYDDFQDFDSSMFHHTTSNHNKVTSANYPNNATDLYASLRERQATLSSSSSSRQMNRKLFPKRTSFIQDEEDDDDETTTCIQNWKDAQCTSTIRLELDDWIRRMAIDTYPLAVVGSSQGHVYLTDLQSGQVLDCIRNVHVSDHKVLDEDDDNDEDEKEEKKLDDRFNRLLQKEDMESQLILDEAMSKLYGPYDGGGVLQLAMYGDVVVSCGREGGVRVFTIQGQEESYFKGSRGGSTSMTKLQLVDQGRLRGLSDGKGRRALITSLVFDKNGMLWVGGYDGILRGYITDGDAEDSHYSFHLDSTSSTDSDTKIPLVQARKPWMEIDIGSPILSVSLNEDLGCGVVATSTLGVVLFSLEDGDILGSWKPFPETLRKKKKDVFARSAMIVQMEEGRWSLLCGASDGRIYQRPLIVDSLGYVSEQNDFTSLDDKLSWVLKPSHSAPVVALSSPFPNLFVSGGLDGTIRVWDASRDLDWDELNSAGIEDEDNTDDDSSEDRGVDGTISSSKRPKCLYALTGYKVWLGSIFTSTKKLVSDGADNTIVVHDFSGEDEENEIEFSFEEDEDDEDEDGGLSLK